MITIELPVYYTQEYKTKSSKTMLVGMNNYRNWHYFIKNNVKQHYHKLVSEALEGLEIKIEGQYRIRYKYWFKNASTDLMNIGALIDKMLADSIQEIGIVENDNVKFYTYASFEVAGQDSLNPRMECIIEERK